MHIPFPSKENPIPPIPPGELSTQVLGHAASIESFLFGGFVVSEGIKAVLKLIGRPIETFQSILDFGCGSARVLRWFGGYPNARWCGSDISREAIDWNRKNLPFGEFKSNGMEPPLPFQDASFDLVYAVSVVTHISEPLQFAWLGELARVVRPGGITILTVMGEAVARWKLSPEEFASFERKGHYYKKVQEGGLHGLPDFYQDAYHSPAYVKREWPRFFQPRAYIRNGPMFLQDTIVLEKSQRDNGYVESALPIGSFWNPRIADKVAVNPLDVAGWTFQHNKGPVFLAVYIDGEAKSVVLANEPTPGVAQVFPAFPGAHSCGFSTSCSIVGLQPGPHVIELRNAEGADEFPFLSTYFFL